jgi:hypothetical protein
MFIRLAFNYEGTPQQATKYAAPFQAIHHIYLNQTVYSSYPEIYKLNGMDPDSSICSTKGLNWNIFSHYVDKADIPSFRTVYNLLNKVTAENSTLSVAVLIEGYATQAVHAVSDSDTAVAFRQRNLLM